MAPPDLPPVHFAMTQRDVVARLRLETGHDALANLPRGLAPMGVKMIQAFAPQLSRRTPPAPERSRFLSLFQAACGDRRSLGPRRICLLKDSANRVNATPEVFGVPCGQPPELVNVTLIQASSRAGDMSAIILVAGVRPCRLGRSFFFSALWHASLRHGFTTPERPG